MNTTNQTSIPKIIWMYWDQGWDEAPELIQQCRKSWQFHNKDWKIRCLDKKNILEFFDIEQWMPGETLKPKVLAPAKRWIYKKLHQGELIKTKQLRVQSKSDIIRINLLEKYGGVWADATLFCRRPLDEWITPHIAQGFFAFSNPDKPLSLKDGSLPLFLSYFLIATKNNYMIKALNQSIYSYWQKQDKMDQYLWVFSLFNNCYDNDKTFAQIWDKVIKIDAPIPYKGEFDKKGGVEFFAWQTPEQLNDLSQDYKEMLKKSSAPMFKLSNKKEYDTRYSSRINYLISKDNEK